MITEVLDVDESPMAKEKNPKLNALNNYDTELLWEVYQEPRLKSGSALKELNSASDALILQYYEQPDTLKAAFGHNISRKDWEK